MTRLTFGILYSQNCQNHPHSRCKSLQNIFLRQIVQHPSFYWVQCLEVGFFEKFSKNSLKNCICTTKTSANVFYENSWYRKFDIHFPDAVWKAGHLFTPAEKSSDELPSRSVCLSKFSFSVPISSHYWRFTSNCTDSVENSKFQTLMCLNCKCMCLNCIPSTEYEMKNLMIR